MHVFQLVKIMCRSFPSRLRVVGDGGWLNARKGLGVRKILERKTFELRICLFAFLIQIFTLSVVNA